MWVNKRERVWRRRAEAAALLAAAQAAEARFAAFDGAVRIMLDDPQGISHLSRNGITRRWCQRSTRDGGNGPSGLSVLEGVVLAGVANRFLDDVVLVRWMSRAAPEALAALNRSAASTVGTTDAGASCSLSGDARANKSGCDE